MAHREHPEPDEDREHRERRMLRELVGDLRRENAELRATIDRLTADPHPRHRLWW